MPYTRRPLLTHRNSANLHGLLFTLEHIDKSQFIRSFLKMSYNVSFMFVVSTMRKREELTLNVPPDKIYSLPLTCQSRLDINEWCPVKSKFNRTSLEVYYNIVFMFEVFTTWTTAKTFDIWVYWLMTSQFRWLTETLWTFTANIRLHTFVTK